VSGEDEGRVRHQRAGVTAGDAAESIGGRLPRVFADGHRGRRQDWPREDATADARRADKEPRSWKRPRERSGCRGAMTRFEKRACHVYVVRAAAAVFSSPWWARETERVCASYVRVRLCAVGFCVDVV
jgi:hypothetical protein